MRATQHNLYRYLNVLSETNQIVATAQDDERMYAQVCRTLVEAGAAAAASVTSVQSGELTVVAAFAGSDESLLHALRNHPAPFVASEAVPPNASSSGQHLTFDTRTAGPLTDAWAKLVKQHGIRAIGAFPLT